MQPSSALKLISPAVLNSNPFCPKETNTVFRSRHLHRFCFVWCLKASPHNLQKELQARLWALFYFESSLHQNLTTSPVLPSPSKPNKRTKQQTEQGTVGNSDRHEYDQAHPPLRSFRKHQPADSASAEHATHASESLCCILKNDAERLENVTTIFTNVAAIVNSCFSQKLIWLARSFACMHGRCLLVTPWAQHQAIALDPRETTACGCRRGRLSKPCSSRYCGHVKRDANIHSRVCPLCARTADSCLNSCVFLTSCVRSGSKPNVSKRTAPQSACVLCLLLTQLLLSKWPGVR